MKPASFFIIIIIVIIIIVIIRDVTKDSILDESIYFHLKPSFYLFDYVHSMCYTHTHTHIILICNINSSAEWHVVIPWLYFTITHNKQGSWSSGEPILSVCTWMQEPRDGIKTFPQFCSISYWKCEKHREAHRKSGNTKRNPAIAKGRKQLFQKRNYKVAYECVGFLLKSFQCMFDIVSKTLWTRSELHGSRVSVCFDRFVSYVKCVCVCLFVCA